MIHSRGLNSSRHGSGELRIASPQVSDSLVSLFCLRSSQFSIKVKGHLHSGRWMADGNLRVRTFNAKGKKIV